MANPKTIANHPGRFMTCREIIELVEYIIEIHTHKYEVKDFLQCNYCDEQWFMPEQDSLWILEHIETHIN